MGHRFAAKRVVKAGGRVRVEPGDRSEALAQHHQRIEGILDHQVHVELVVLGFRAHKECVSGPRLGKCAKIRAAVDPEASGHKAVGAGPQFLQSVAKIGPGADYHRSLRVQIDIQWIDVLW